jgi:hydrogenase maturation factor
VGDFVMVQMGFAVSRISEDEANEVIDALDQIVDLSGLRSPADAGTKLVDPEGKP